MGESLPSSLLHDVQFLTLRAFQALGCILYCLAFFVHPFQDSGNLGIANGKYSIPDKHSYSKHLIYLIQKIFTVECAPILLAPLSPATRILIPIFFRSPTLRPNINQVMEYTEKWKEILSGKAVANIASILEGPLASADHFCEYRSPPDMLNFAS